MMVTVKIIDAYPGMILANCVFDSDGKIIVAEGVAITQTLIKRLIKWRVKEI